MCMLRSSQSVISMRPFVDVSKDVPSAHTFYLLQWLFCASLCVVELYYMYFVNAFADHTYCALYLFSGRVSYSFSSDNGFQLVFAR